MSYQSRVKTWIAGEVLYASDLNAEFDAILATLIPEPSSVVQGDILYKGASTWDRLAAGTAGQALTTGGASANPAWAGMTTAGDIEYFSTTRARLAKGTAHQKLKMNSGATAPAWATDYFVNVKEDYSATGDGSTDDSTAIQNAINALTSGGTLYFPHGTYMCKNVGLASNIRILGDFGAIIKAVSTADTGDHVLGINGKTDVVIEGLEINGNSGVVTGDVILIYIYGTSSNIIIKNNYLQNSAYNAIMMGGTMSNILIDGNIFDTTDCGVITMTNQTRKLTIVNNQISSGTSEGISIYGNDSYKGYEQEIVIGNNIIYDKAGSGIKMRYTDHFSITGNVIYGCTTGIDFDLTPSYPKNGLIAANKIYDCDGGISGGLNDSIISDNHVSEMDDCGISIGYCGNLIIKGNLIKNTNINENDSDGIRLDTVTSVSVLDNLVMDDNETPIIYAGIRVYGTSSDGVYIRNNDIGDMASYGMLLKEGSNYEVSNNHVVDGYTVQNMTGEIAITQMGLEEVTAESPTLSTWGFTKLDSGSNAITATLPDGTTIGQIKTIVMTEASNSSTVSATHHETSDPEVATFDAVDETWVLVWTGTEWATIKATCTFV